WFRILQFAADQKTTPEPSTELTGAGEARRRGARDGAQTFRTSGKDPRRSGPLASMNAQELSEIQDLSSSKVNRA
ncbi:MAG TPA: hypothetical protein VF226_20790, partial [Hyphomicrobiaceae bacterium]